MQPSYGIILYSVHGVCAVGMCGPGHIIICVMAQSLQHKLVIGNHCHVTWDLMFKGTRHTSARLQIFCDKKNALLF